jgi:hypothetical protein
MLHRYWGEIDGRAFSVKLDGREHAAAVPFLDMVNHQPHALCFHTYQPATAQFELRSLGPPLELGAESIITYGSKANNARQAPPPPPSLHDTHTHTQSFSPSLTQTPVTVSTPFPPAYFDLTGIPCPSLTLGWWSNTASSYLAILLTVFLSLIRPLSVASASAGTRSHTSRRPCLSLHFVLFSVRYWLRGI